MAREGEIMHTLARKKVAKVCIFEMTRSHNGEERVGNAYLQAKKEAGVCSIRRSRFVNKRKAKDGNLQAKSKKTGNTAS